MACIVNLQIPVYNQETKKWESKTIQLDNIEGIDIDENTKLTMEQVAQILGHQSKVKLKEISDSLSGAKAIPLTIKMINSGEVVGNTTVQGLLDEYGLGNEFQFNDVSLYNSYNIVRCNQFKLNNVEYNGRVITADGKELFVIKSKYDAQKFLRYLKSKERIAQALKDGSLEQIVGPELWKTFQELVDYKKTSKNLNTPEKLLIQYLNDRDSITDYVGSDGKVHNSRKLLGNILAKVNDIWNSDNNLTDLELALQQITVKSDNQFDWKIPKKAFYDVLAKYIPDFADKVSWEAFKQADNDTLSKLLFSDENGENPGLFLGLPKLGRAALSDITFSQPNDTAEDKVKTITEHRSPQVSAKLLAKKWNESLWGKYSDFDKLSAQEKIDFITSNKIEIPIEDDEKQILPRVITAHLGSTGKIVYNYDYTVTKTVKVAPRESTSYITLSFPYESIGETYDFGYNTEYLFSPVNEEGVNNGEYQGMYIYRRLINGKTVYAVGRNIISPQAHMKFVPTIEAAKKAIETANNSSTILENSLFTLKQTPDKRTTRVQQKDLRVGQVLTVSDIQVPSTQIKSMVPSISEMFRQSMTYFHSVLRNIPGTETIYTPEQAAAFLAKCSDYIQKNKLQGSSPYDLISAIPEDIIQSYIDEIVNAGKLNYIIEKIIPNKEIGVPIVTLRQIGDKESKLDVNGRKIGDTNIGDYITQIMDAACKHIQKQYGVPINQRTFSELQEEFKGTIPDYKLKRTRAFIYNGQIYINTSNSNLKDLYHEVAHIVLGIIKVNNPEEYDRIIQTYMNDGNFRLSMDYKRRSYPNLARRDIAEETVADMIAKQLDDNQTLTSKEFDAQLFNTTMNDILGHIEYFKSAVNDSDIGFDGFIKKMVTNDNVTTQMQKQRIATNAVEEMIKDHKIIENCNA